MDHSRLLIHLILLTLTSHTHSTTFTLLNKCPYTIWPATLSGATSPQLPPGSSGFSLPSTSTTTFSAPPHWSGRIWARTSCSINSTTSLFTCLTGDCATGTIPCSGHTSTPPTTLAEFTLNGDNGLDFYDVSLVDGFNLPLIIVPSHEVADSRREKCSVVGCYVDLNDDSCPSQLQLVTEQSVVVGCRSACEVFGDAAYCCSEEYATPDRCKPSVYSEFFKNVCPTAYSYAFDDPTSTFTCVSGGDYVITFCPTPVATSKSNDPNDGQQQLLPGQPSSSYTWPSTSTTLNNNSSTTSSLFILSLLLLFLCSLLLVLNT